MNFGVSWGAVIRIDTDGNARLCAPSAPERSDAVADQRDLLYPPGMRIRMPLFIALVGAACTPDLPVSTDTDPGPVAPTLNIIGEWWLESGDRLPTQEETWCEDLVPDRFDNSRCFVEPTACEQGMAFETPNGRQRARWLVQIQATECGADLPIEVWADSSYGGFEWLGRAESGTGEVWRVNAREWVIEPTATPGMVVVQSSDKSFVMTEEFRFDP